MRLLPKERWKRVASNTNLPSCCRDLNANKVKLTAARLWLCNRQTPLQMIVKVDINYRNQFWIRCRDWARKFLNCPESNRNFSHIRRPHSIGELFNFLPVKANEFRNSCVDSGWYGYGPHQTQDKAALVVDDLIIQSRIPQSIKLVTLAGKWEIAHDECRLNAAMLLMESSCTHVTFLYCKIEFIRNF